MAMPVLRVKAVANVMGLRRGDEGEVVAGDTFVDAMVNAGYLKVLETYPDPEPPRRRGRRRKFRAAVAAAQAGNDDPNPPMVEIEGAAADLAGGEQLEHTHAAQELAVSVDYTSMTAAQLRASARARGLGTSGTKAELVARLEAADAGAAHPSDGLPKPG